MLGGVVAKWDALFSTESLWDTQVGHQRAGRTRKIKDDDAEKKGEGNM